MINRLRRARSLFAPSVILFLIVAGLTMAGVNIAGIQTVPTASAAGGNAPGSLDCPTLTKYNPTHYGLQVGTTVTCTIVGATDLPAGTTSVDVIIKSSENGNTTVTGTVVDTTITFSYTAPAGNCETGPVAYGTDGNNTNNDIIDDGVQNGSGTAAAGLAYLDSNGKLVTVCSGSGVGHPGDLIVSKTAITSFTRTFTWGIAKSVDTPEIDTSDSSGTFNYTVNVTHDSGTDGGWQVNGTITVQNPNPDFAVNGVTVTDAIDNNGNCTVTGGTDVSVPANGSVDLKYSCTYSSAPTPNNGINTASATWDITTDQPTPDDSASGTQSYAFGDPTTLVDDCVTVTDPLAPDGTFSKVCSTDLSPTTFIYSYTVNGTPGTCVTQDNTATFTTNTTGTTGSDSKTVKLCVGADLSVSKNANPTFTRTYNWSIAKSVDKTLVEQIGGTTTFNYTVTAAETGFTDSGWAVNGTITVTNPNDWESITANVTDAVNDGGTCTVTGGNVLIAAGQTANLPYTCTYPSSGPSPLSGTNTATATWDAGAAFTSDSSATGSATFDFSTATPTPVNQTINVTDSYAGPLGSAGPATDTMPYFSKSFTYSRTVNVPTTGCVTYPNTATIVETGVSASASVEVCGPAKTGTLTMGYWQNKNGQGIITGGSSTSAVCNSGTWLRKYAPFQDLSATATCAQTATYVTNVIKAATCSGTTQPCNTMLKAQMLATALDVYFSDPALGGNKINAPAPIGGVTIDLTKICKMIDGSGGTATCGGTYEDVSSAFSSSHETVLTMLNDAASQSNVGGSTWYANVKATQILAKDAFDAINNQVAFSI